jgi:transposase
MEVMYQRVAGLDVHKQTVVACVRVMAGRKVVRECRTFATTTDGLLSLLAWLSEARCSHVAMEATGVYWMPVWKILSDGPFELLVANAAHIKNVPGRKTDLNDAMWIADLMACGLIKASFVPEEPFQELRSLMRTRKQLSREQTRRGQHGFPGGKRYPARNSTSMNVRLTEAEIQAPSMACRTAVGSHR